ncbi:MAG: hypothetical protein U9O94_06050 [Nanoarchaeota archaeon]|nr:hypothetical protein [Nanoarchaeota archaeon]
MFNSKVKSRGRVDIYLNGVHVRCIENMVVTTGHEFITSRMKDATADVMTHMAIGTNTTAAALGDTTLGTEVARVALNVSGGVVSGNTITYEATFPADVPDVTDPDKTPVTEVGLFNAASGGTMLAHAIFAVVNKGELDPMTVSWVITNE